MKNDFDPGALFVTRGIQHADIPVEPLYLRHCLGDWGDLSADDKELNDEAAACNLREGRILSVYLVGEQKIYLITEHDPEVGENRTIVMLAEEY